MFSSAFARFFEGVAGPQAPQQGIKAMSRLFGRAATGSAVGMGINFGYNTVSGDTGGYARAAALGALTFGAHKMLTANKAFKADLATGFASLRANGGDGSIGLGFKKMFGYDNLSASTMNASKATSP